MRGRRVVVAGAGVGGLAAAIRLAAAGYDVVLVERSSVGGKMAAVELAGRRVDTGPTVLTMRWVFEELFAAAGQRLDERLQLMPCDVLARHGWADGTRLDLFADRDRSAAEIARVFGAREAEAFRHFCSDAEATFDVVSTPFLRSQRPGPMDLLRHARDLGWSPLVRIDALRTMWSSLQAHFHEPRLRQLFGRYATYCGSSPFEAPATLNVVAHVESCGVHRVQGGLEQLARALRTLAEELGCAVITGEVSGLDLNAGRVAAAVLVDGTRLPCEAVIWNGDVAAVRGLVSSSSAGALPAPTRPADRSLSALTWAMVAEVRRPAGFPLLHHNVLFGEDYEAEHAALAAGHIAEDATIYVCAQDRADHDDEAGPGESLERFLLVVNAKANGDEPAAWSEKEMDRCERTVFSRMRAFGIDLTTEPQAMLRRGPREYATLYPRTGGALYGPRSRGATSALSRAPARSGIRGLYLTGGSVHPGPGVPMAALSGRLAAEALQQDLPPAPRSMPSSRAGGTNGTTSTR